MILNIALAIAAYAFVGWFLWYFPVYIAARYIIKQGHSGRELRSLLTSLQYNWDYGNGLTSRKKTLCSDKAGVIKTLMFFWPITIVVWLIKWLLGGFVELLRSFSLTDPIKAAKVLHTKVEVKDAKPAKDDGHLSVAE